MISSLCKRLSLYPKFARSKHDTSCVRHKLTQKITSIQLLSEKCREERTQTSPLGRHKMNAQRYDSRQNTITSSYASNSPRPIASTSYSRSAEELHAVCASLTQDLLSIGTTRQLQDLLVVLPKIALWWTRNLSQHKDAASVFVTLLQAVLDVIATDHSAYLCRELSFQTCANMMLLMTIGSRYNESVYNPARFDRKPLHTYFMMCPETLYGHLLQEWPIFMNLHEVTLKQSVADLKSCRATLQSKEQKRDVKNVVKRYVSLHPKLFTAIVELSLDGLFLLDRSAYRESYSLSLNAFLDEIFVHSSSNTLSLLSVYPCRYVSRLVRAFLYLSTRQEVQRNPFFMEELVKVTHTVLRGIEANSLLPLLRCVRYFDAWLASTSDFCAVQLKANCFVLLISMGDEAGRRVEEIPHDHRKGIIAIFQSLKNANVIASCDALDRVLSGLTQL